MVLVWVVLGGYACGVVLLEVLVVMVVDVEVVGVMLAKVVGVELVGGVWVIVVGVCGGCWGWGSVGWGRAAGGGGGGGGGGGSLQLRPTRQPGKQRTKKDHAPKAFTSPFCGLMFFFIFLDRFGREMFIHNALGN